MREQVGRFRRDRAGTDVLGMRGSEFLSSLAGSGVGRLVGSGSRRAVSVVAAAVLVGLLVVPEAFARAGGGSSSFGRGGGGGGVGRGFGRGHFFFIPVGGGGGLLLFILVLVVVFLVLPRVLSWWQGQRSAGVVSRRRVASRERRVELAAAEAAEDDAAFAPERVRSQAARLFVDIQSAWDAGDRVRLRGLVAPELLAEWERRLDDFDRKGWRNRVRPIGEPSIEYVGLTNRGEDRQDRVVVRIEARLSDYVEDAYGQRVGRVDALGDTTRRRALDPAVDRTGRRGRPPAARGRRGHPLERRPGVARRGVGGGRYLEDRDTAAVVAGSQSRAAKFTERWTLALDGPDEQPWRITAVRAPAGRP